MFKIDEPFPFSTRLISLDRDLEEMINLYDSNRFPKVLLLSGKKGIGKFTLVFHFINYIYSKKEKTPYNTKEKIINTNSSFYNSIMNQTCSDVLWVHAAEGKNIKIDEIRSLKSQLTTTSLSDNPRFTVIDEVEFLNTNSVNALLKTLEEPSDNNYFILVNNQQADLIETVSSRCLKNNIYLNSDQKKKIIDYFIESHQINFQIDETGNLTPGLLLKYSDLVNKHKIDINESIYFKLSKLLFAYKKDKNKSLINMSIFLIDQFFYSLIKENKNKIDFLLSLKLTIINKINDFIVYNLNINSVLKSIEIKLKYVR